MFQLHPILEKDTVPVASLTLSRALLMNDSRFPWLILVPARADVREIIDLAPDDRALLWDEVMQASHVMRDLYKPDKLNMGALGNLVPQLHIHVIARFCDDAAWPGPVWGHGETISYEPDRLETVRNQLAETLT